MAQSSAPHWIPSTQYSQELLLSREPRTFASTAGYGPTPLKKELEGIFRWKCKWEYREGLSDLAGHCHLLISRFTWSLSLRMLCYINITWGPEAWPMSGLRHIFHQDTLTLHKETSFLLWQHVVAQKYIQTWNNPPPFQIPRVGAISLQAPFANDAANDAVAIFLGNSISIHSAYCKGRGDARHYSSTSEILTYVTTWERR